MKKTILIAALSILVLTVISTQAGKSAPESNQVEVINAPDNPVPVQITKQRKVISSYSEQVIPASETDVTVTVMTVPAGKVVVITDASYVAPRGFHLYEDSTLKLPAGLFPQFTSFISGIPFASGTNINFVARGPIDVASKVMIFISGYEITE